MPKYSSEVAAKIIFDAAYCALPVVKTELCMRYVQHKSKSQEIINNIHNNKHSMRNKNNTNLLIQ
jgi:hypothetical protein